MCRGAVSIMVQQKCIQLGTVRLQVQSLALLSGLRIWCCPELWCRSQTWLGSDVALAIAPIQPPAWELPYVKSADVKKKKKELLHCLSVLRGFRSEL